jgi:hypothetical protein
MNQFLDHISEDVLSALAGSAFSQALVRPFGIRALARYQCVYFAEQFFEGNHQIAPLRWIVAGLKDFQLGVDLNL